MVLFKDFKNNLSFLIFDVCGLLINLLLFLVWFWLILMFVWLCLLGLEKMIVKYLLDIR